MTPDVALPAAMVEAAAEVLSVDATGFFYFNGEDWREKYRDLARKALTAALDVCQVREEWRATDGQGRSYWSGNREGLVNWATYPGRSEVTYSRRLSIRTPAEPDPTAGA